MANSMNPAIIHYKDYHIRMDNTVDSANNKLTTLLYIYYKDSDEPVLATTVKNSITGLALAYDWIDQQSEPVKVTVYKERHKALELHRWLTV